jgi:hypothetical protein
MVRRISEEYVFSQRVAERFVTRSLRRRLIAEEGGYMRMPGEYPVTTIEKGPALQQSVVQWSGVLQAQAFIDVNYFLFG